MTKHYTVHIPEGHEMREYFGEFFAFRLLGDETPEDILFALSVSPLNTGFDERERAVCEDLTIAQMERDKIIEEGL